MKHTTHALQLAAPAADARPRVASGLGLAPAPAAIGNAVLANAAVPATAALMAGASVAPYAMCANAMIDGLVPAVGASTTEWFRQHTTKRPSRHLGDTPT